MFILDHIAVVARTLDEGAAYVRDQLGIELPAGGTHPDMGTHNRLVGFQEGFYLEVIAIDPNAMAPPYPRWFDLDTFDGTPRIGNWILRCADTGAALSALGAQYGRVLPLKRADLRWEMIVPQSGRLPYDNCAPALISWKSALHPVDLLPKVEARLKTLSVSHPDAGMLSAELAPHFSDPRVVFAPSDTIKIEAEIVVNGKVCSL
ncbi:MAG: VOC family protein [Halocynthiibacter sp.]